MVLYNALPTGIPGDNDDIHTRSSVCVCMYLREGAMLSGLLRMCVCVDDVYRVIGM